MTIHQQVAAYQAIEATLIYLNTKPSRARMELFLAVQNLARGGKESIR